MKALSILLVVALASPVGADPATDHATAVQLFEDGRRLMAANDAAGACAKFAAAIQLEPLAAGTMLNLGLCNEQLNRFKTALDWFRKAQLRATETDPPMPAYEKEAREHSAHLAALVASIRIAVPAGGPDDATVTIDGEPVKREEFARVEIDPGHHVVVATAAGKTAIRREIDVTGTGGQTLTLVFENETKTSDAHPAITAAPVVEASDDRSDWRVPTSVGLAIGGGVLLATSLGLTLYEKHVYNQNAAAAKQGDHAALVSTQDATAVARDWGTGLAVAGLIAGGAAAYLYFTRPAPQLRDRAAVVPAIMPGGAGVVAVGRF